ncbi:hypothetical protein DFS34DRAFT_665706 [Phlyctochytrium arcticum]|nr:hypothetical protein DFS34DRAFT_665706 [Phlyctochytrium arcticum]
MDPAVTITISDISLGAICHMLDTYCRHHTKRLEPSRWYIVGLFMHAAIENTAMGNSPLVIDEEKAIEAITQAKPTADLPRPPTVRYYGAIDFVVDHTARNAHIPKDVALAGPPTSLSSIRLGPAHPRWACISGLDSASMDHLGWLRRSGVLAQDEFSIEFYSPLSKRVSPSSYSLRDKRSHGRLLPQRGFAVGYRASKERRRGRRTCMHIARFSKRGKYEALRVQDYVVVDFRPGQECTGIGKGYQYSCMASNLS